MLAFKVVLKMLALSACHVLLVSRVVFSIILLFGWWHYEYTICEEFLVRTIKVCIIDGGVSVTFRICYTSKLQRFLGGGTERRR